MSRKKSGFGVPVVAPRPSVPLTFATEPRRKETETSLSIEASDPSLAPATLRVYGTAWRYFTRWCETRGYEPLPAARRKRS